MAILRRSVDEQRPCDSKFLACIPRTLTYRLAYAPSDCRRSSRTASNELPRCNTPFATTVVLRSDRRDPQAAPSRRRSNESILSVPAYRRLNRQAALLSTADSIAIVEEANPCQDPRTTTTDSERACPRPVDLAIAGRDCCKSHVQHHHLP